MHIIITLTRNGIFNIWDEFQNNLYEFYDESLDITKCNNCNENSEYVIYSDIQNNPTKEGTWLVLSKKGESWIRIYAVATWKRVIKTNIGNGNNGIFIQEPYLGAQLTLEREIYAPLPDPSTISNQVPIETKKTPKEDEKEKDKEKEKEANEQKESTPDNENSEVVSETTDDIKNLTVTGVTAYQHSKRKMFLVSYDNGKIYSYRLTGVVSGSFVSENKTIVTMSQTNKKLEIVFATDYGFRFIKLPKLSKLGRFCKYPVKLDCLFVFVVFENI